MNEKCLVKAEPQNIVGYVQTALKTVEEINGNLRDMNRTIGGGVPEQCENETQVSSTLDALQTLNFGLQIAYEHVRKLRTDLGA